MDERYLIMTVDTEGDDLWNWHEGQPIRTENARCTARFQSLCERYALPPVYLVNYEMARSDALRDALAPKQEQGLCEIGMHVHAWNSPPHHALSGSFGGQPYITEYPADVVMEKHRYLKELIRERFGAEPVTYRSGRWATNGVLWDTLALLGFKVDCSTVPGIDLKSPGLTVDRGPDYTAAPAKPYYIRRGLLEVPMTAAKRRSLNGATVRRWARNLLKGEELWLRPIFGDAMMARLMRIVRNEDRGYLEIMIHSSELMPGASPYIRTQEELEQMYGVLERLIEKASGEGYRGVTLREFGERFAKRKGNV